MISFEQALTTVRQQLQAAARELRTETVELLAGRGRVLADDLRADRDIPPFHRSTRDGFAVRSSDAAAVAATLQVTGLARAGAPFAGRVAAGCAVEIMTGAPLPEGADAVAMVEYTREASPAAPGGSGPARRVEISRAVGPGENVIRQGSEAAAGSIVLPRGRRLGPGEIGLAAAVGCCRLPVFARPHVAILPTGDEVVPVDQRPDWFQIRNSNGAALAAQVEAAGGAPRLLGAGPDNRDALRTLVEEALDCDLLLLSGGISVGKHDYVAEVLTDLGAEIYFQGVAIRPGKPLTFGRVRERFFFALPGNPVSTFVTFEAFVRPALGVLGGAEFEPAAFLKARLGKPLQQKTGLTVFMPARVAPACADSNFAPAAGQQGEVASDPVVELVGWQGSGDLVGLAQANCFLVAFPAQTDLAAGDWVDVLPKSW